jgi:hypothetical protein
MMEEMSSGVVSYAKLCDLSHRLFAALGHDEALAIAKEMLMLGLMTEEQYREYLESQGWSVNGRPKRLQTP